MTSEAMNESTRLTPEHNALDSLRRVADELEGDTASLLRLKGVLAWGWHAIGLLAYLRLHPHSDVFDAWVRDYLDAGHPDLEVERDAHWEERQRLSLLEIVDLLSAENLSILKPGFYQGWQDRTSRCRQLRSQVTQLLGASIGDEQRRDLLLLLAAYHRLIRLPAGVELDPASVLLAVPALLELADMLVDRSSAMAPDIARALNRCRGALAVR